ncbi:MAG: GNAT family protein [bacterium]|nr:GNAT family protein [bacterium]
MDLSPITLEGRHVRLEPLAIDHHDRLVEAAADGSLWELRVTTVPPPEEMAGFIKTILYAREQEHEVPFTILHKPSGRVVGLTRFLDIDPPHRKVEIGGTWLAESWQRSAINTEAKFLLLRHAFEAWACIRVQFVTDVLNDRSRAALLRIGAKEEGILRYEMIMRDGRYRDSVCFSIIEPEWPAVKAALQAKLEKQY